MKFTQTLIAAGLVLAATPAFAVEAGKSIEVKAAPSAVWKTIGDFCGIGQWHPAVEKCEMSMKGSKHMRTLSLKGGGTIVEEELSRDDAKMTYSYAIVESPLPVENYKSTIMVAKDGEGSKVSWTGTFKAKGADDAKAQSVIDGIYEAGLKGIAKKAM